MYTHAFICIYTYAFYDTVRIHGDGRTRVFFFHLGPRGMFVFTAGATTRCPGTPLSIISLTIRTTHVYIRTPERSLPKSVYILILYIRVAAAAADVVFRLL